MQVAHGGILILYNESEILLFILISVSNREYPRKFPRTKSYLFKIKIGGITSIPPKISMIKSIFCYPYRSIITDTPENFRIPYFSSKSTERSQVLSEIILTAKKSPRHNSFSNKYHIVIDLLHAVIAVMHIQLFLDRVSGRNIILPIPPADQSTSGKYQVSRHQDGKNGA